MKLGILIRIQCCNIVAVCLRLIRCVEYLYRVLATAICYVVFGLLAIGIWSIGFPLIVLLVPKPNRLKTAHLVAHYCFRFFIGWMRFLRVLSYEVIDEERLRQQGQLIVANHPSLIDIVFLISRVDNAVCIVGKELLNNPFMSSAIKHGGYVVNSDPDLLVDDCATVLRQQMSLIIFPQGTRTPLSRLFKFQRGSARIALQAQVNITPVYIECHPSHLMKGQQWYNIPLTRPHYRIIVGDAIIPEQHIDSVIPSLASRQLTRFLERYFVKQYDSVKQ
ncbi:MAG: lysophospholipid acyltransferase family protein [Methylococcales bacterium]